ncbi:hypothetical protein [Bacillus toyonensis]|uniref:Uncharacterized protein n=1 Tax=Bacillus toyonensis TaxID=155322 RepID=A0A2C4QE95_9BACI|nr:hypothetical protein [Bacillus toyonensis]PGB02045.1 hypothetical protein COL93_13550 [Bacillus toyonensis]PHD63346.1 hypothetical protein COF40_25285 [Bacillus toyonensis]
MMDGVTKGLYEIHKSFFKNYFEDEGELERFVLEKIAYQKDNIPRRMINTVHRLVTLSEEMRVVRPGSRDLTIFFILTCIETLYNLVPDMKMKKQDIIIDFFEKYLCENDKCRIQKGISILLSDHNTPFFKEISIEQFSLMLTAVRNNLAHEGVYWVLHFREEDSDVKMLHNLNSKLKKDEGYRDITYEIGITYKEFKLACMKAFINFMNEYYRTYCLSD